MSAISALFILTNEIIVIDRKMLERRLCLKGLVDIAEGIMIDL